MNNYDDLEKNLENKLTSKNRTKRQKMKVSGRSVLNLKRIIGSKNQEIKKTR